MEDDETEHVAEAGHELAGGVAIHRVSAAITSSGAKCFSIVPVVCAAPPNQQLVTMRFPRAIGISSAFRRS